MTRYRNDSLGVVLSTVTEGSPQEFVELAQLAESLGYASVLVNEGRGDALAYTQAIAAGTTQIGVGTNIANVYFRHPYLAAGTARAIADLSDGRLTVGFGISHRALLAALGIDMGDARTYLGEYVEAVKLALAGEAGNGFLKSPASAFDVPIYVAANTIETATVAGRHGDGIMPFLTPASHLPTLVDAARAASAQPGQDNEHFGCIMSIPTFVSDDETAAQSAARYNLAFFGQLPNYRRQWRRAGYGTAMTAVKSAWEAGGRREAATQIPDELIDDVCVFGSAQHCREKLQSFRTAGADLPVLAVSPVNEERLEATRKALVALSPRETGEQDL